MTPVVLFILAVVWSVYLFTWFRARRERRGVNSISSFSRHLSVLERTSPARPGAPATSSRGNARPEPIYPSARYVPPRPAMSISAARRRRRNVLYALAGGALAALILSPFLGTLMMGLSIVLGACFAAYVVLLARTQKLANERRDKVVYLPVGHQQAEPQLLLQRSAN